MALQGENINITLSGDSSINLDTIDFKVTAYISPNIESLVTITKAQCTPQANNKYLCVIPYTSTKTMAIGSYTIEVLDNTNKSIYIKNNAFILNLSASKTLL